ncbi:MAG: hypothetical protein KAJ90_08150, partial [Desulfobacterales bacterium]|nr:hypothetical protein [Desulfobacterales bacterium]
MAEWPTGLPAPQKKIGVTPGDTRIERKLQSGRTEFRRFGNGMPDQLKVLIRLLWAQWETFKIFYEYDLNLGVNWFSADWLIVLGYDDYKAKILGYPREVARQNHYVDVVCDLLIQKTSWIIGEDTSWACAGSGPDPDPIAGYIYGGFNLVDYLQDTDQYIPDVWVSKIDMPVPGRNRLEASTIGNLSYIYGGYNGSSHLQDCDEYTPDVWVSKTDMPLPERSGTAASTIGDSGYVYCGYGGTSLSDCDEYTPD